VVDATRGARRVSRRTTVPARCIAAALLGVFHLACASAATEELSRARELTDRRDFAPALVIFDRLCAAKPDDSDLAIERARVLGFADRNAEAAAAYAEVARRHPQRRADVRVAWAWQVLWSGRPEAAEPLFREAVAAAPAATEPRRGLAQSLLWSGREREALAEFDRVLALDPGSRDAASGRALALNHSGRALAAARAYAELVPSTDAGLQLQAARAYYWAGFPDRAEPLLARSPLPEAQHLRDFRIRRETGQSFVASYADYSSDADDLDVMALSATGGWRVASRGTIEGSLRRTTLDGPDTSAWPSGRHRVETDQAFVAWSSRLGSPETQSGVLWPMLALGGRDVDGWTTLAWKGRVRYALDDTWTFDASAGNGVPETVGAARNEIDYTEATVGAEARPAPRWRTAGHVTRIAYAGGNDRSQVSGRVEYLIVPSRQLRLGIDALHFTDDEPSGPVQPDLGYWNPDRYTEARLYASIGAERGSWSWDARASAGGMRERDGWGTTTSDPTFAASGTVAYDFSPGLQLRAYLGGSRSGAGIGGGGSGYYRTYAGISLTGYFGAD
jgi:tetratricopeptide (TPR) repeat protein